MGVGPAKIVELVGDEHDDAAIRIVSKLALRVQKPLDCARRVVDLLDLRFALAGSIVKDEEVAHWFRRFSMNPTSPPRPRAVKLSVRVPSPVSTRRSASLACLNHSSLSAAPTPCFKSVFSCSSKIWTIWAQMVSSSPDLNLGVSSVELDHHMKRPVPEPVAEMTRVSDRRIFGREVLEGDLRGIPGAVRASAGLGTSGGDIDALLAALSDLAGGAPPPVPYEQDAGTGDYFPVTDEPGWRHAAHELGAACSRG